MFLGIPEIVDTSWFDDISDDIVPIITEMPYFGPLGEIRILGLRSRSPVHYPTVLRAGMKYNNYTILRILRQLYLRKFLEYLHIYLR